jgi:hypothetical protein
MARRHVGHRRRIGQRRLGQRIAAVARLQAEQAVQRIAGARAGRRKARDERLGRGAADVQTEAAAAARTGTSRRRSAARHRVRRERIPVLGNATDGRGGRGRACGTGIGTRRRDRLGIEAERCQRVGHALCGTRDARCCRCLGTGRREQPGERIVARCSGGNQRALHRQHVAADLQAVAFGERRLASVADIASVDLDRVAAAIDHRVAAGAEHDLRVHARDRAIRIFEDQLVGVGPSDRAAELVERGRSRPRDWRTVVGNDGQGDHGRCILKLSHMGPCSATP